MKKNLTLLAITIICGIPLAVASVANRSFEETTAAAAFTALTIPDQTRCGWFSNPTPGNFWLDDKDGEWIIGTQGGFQAEGDYPPPFKKTEWVKTNGDYGYGCACFKGRFNSETNQVEVVKSAYARPLSVCRKDKTLKEPE
ncbi:MAG: DUF4087 domain-containing protein [Acidobacteria bacterium]|nr:DUF4087 domain-containing protein [Acidobacteriota bacterium]